jgi:hypothetical protein
MFISLLKKLFKKSNGHKKIFNFTTVLTKTENYEVRSIKGKIHQIQSNKR